LTGIAATITDEEAIAIANNSPYGLSGALFCADKGKAYISR